MQAKNPSWARVAALLTACTATLIGVWHGFDPEEILVRAAVAAVAIALLTNLIYFLTVTLGTPGSSR